MAVNAMPQEMLVGPIGALRTFTKENGEIDLDKQRFHLNWVIENGITTGNGCIMVAAGGRFCQSPAGTMGKRPFYRSFGVGPWFHIALPRSASV